MRECRIILKADARKFYDGVHKAVMRSRLDELVRSLAEFYEIGEPEVREWLHDLLVGEHEPVMREPA